MRGIIIVFLLVSVLWGQEIGKSFEQDIPPVEPVVEVRLTKKEIGRPFLNAGHSSNVSTLKFSPNGKYIASGSYDNTIKLWDRQNGKLIRTLRGHKDMVDAISFNHNGDILASASWDSTIKLWNVQNGKLIKTIKNDPRYNSFVSFSPDGNFLAYPGFDSIKIWDIKSKKTINILNNIKSINSISFSVNGKKLAFATNDGVIESWDYKRKKLLKRFKNNNITYAITFSPDGKILASGHLNRNIKLWDSESGKLLKILKGPSTVESLSFHPNGKLLASGCADNTIKIWDIKKRKIIKTLIGHSGAVFSIDFSADGKTLLSGSQDTTVRVWNTKDGKLLKDLKGIDSVSTFNYHPTKKLLASVHGNFIKLWDYKMGKLLKNIDFENISSSSDIIFSPNGKVLALGCGDGKIKLWDSKDGKLLKTLNAHVDGSIITFSPNGKFLVSGSNDGHIKLWDMQSKKLLSEINDDGSIMTIAVSPNGKFLVSGDRQGFITFHAKKNKSFISQNIREDTEQIRILVFSPDGKILASGSQDGIIRLWNTENGKLLKTLIGHSGAVLSIDFSADGKTLLSGSQDTTVRVWNTKDGKLIKTLYGHTDWVNHVEFNPNQKYFTSCSSDGIIKLWSMINFNQLLKVAHFDKNEWIAITPEGYYNASKNGAKHLNVLTSPMTVTSVDSFAEKFYRPDIVKLAMQGKKVDTKVKMSDIKPAPEVEMMHVPQKIDDKQVEITLKIKDMGGGIGDVRIYRNGTAVALKSRDVQRSQKDLTYRTFVIPLEKGKNKLEAIAFESTNSLRSEPDIKNLFASYTDTTKPSLHAVIIGIKEFRNHRLNLLYTKNDAIALKKTLEKHTQTLFDEVDVTLLTSKEETSKENITKVLESLTSLNPNDLFLLFIASHGTVDDGDYYLITSNVGSTRTEKLKKDALSQAEITKLISNIPTGKKLIILDTCHSGALGESIKVALLQRGMSEDTAIKILSRATGTTILSASLSAQQALEGYKGHGLFSYVLLEGIKGKSDLNGDGFIKTPELVDYIDERVPELSQKVFGVEQFPTVNLDGQAFPITQIVQ